MLNNDFFIFFVLAHLTGDYVLQTDKIAKIKSEGFKGVALHILLVGLIQLILLSFFGVWGIVAALLGAGSHFLIDSLKVILGNSLKKIELFYYFIDQGLHLLVILLLTYSFAPEKSSMGSYIPYANLFIGLILLFYTSTVTAKNVVRYFFSDIIKRKFFEKNERWIDALTGGILYVSYLVHPVLAVLILLSGALKYCRIQKALYKYTCQVSLAKLFILVLFTFLVVNISSA